jgi:hypothetical protein
MIVTNSITFARSKKESSQDGLVLQGARKTTVVSPGKVQNEKPVTVGSPRLIFECLEGAVEMAALSVDARRVSNAVVARGLLDQAVPTVVTDTLAILAEIAVDRAKAGALELVRKKFVQPVCNGLTLGALHVGESEKQALPRTCELLNALRLEDILSSGRNLLDAVRDDVRLTLAPAIAQELGLPQEGIKVAKLALDFANQLMDDARNKTLSLDLLVTMLDRVVSLSGLEYSVSITLDWATSSGFAVEVYSALLERVVPDDPEAWLDEDATELQKRVAASWAKVSDCLHTPAKRSGYVIPPTKAACIKALSTIVDLKWVQTMIADKVLNVDDLVQAARRHATKAFSDWVAEKGKDYVSTLFQNEANKLQLPRDVLERGCAARVVLGIAKWCSGREACSVGDVAKVLEHPETVFKPASALPDALCWEKVTLTPAQGAAPAVIVDRLILPRVRDAYIELAARAVSFLTPAAKGEEEVRALELVRWMFDLAVTLDADESHVAALKSFREVVLLLAKRDYMTAMTRSLGLAVKYICKPTKDRACVLPPSATLATKFVGAIGSYMQVYNETSDKDPAAARDARRKALESLIDASTDRKERTGAIFSLGIPVGVTVAERWTRGSDDTFHTPDEWYGGDYYVPKLNSFAWRLPLALGVQSPSSCYHFAITFLDLGNYLHSTANHEVHWDDFLSFGAQAGITFGDSKHIGVLAADFSWSPTAYENTDKTGAFQFGLTLAYYVPLFDLN